MQGKAWQAVLDQGVGEMWKRPGSGPEGTVQLLAEAAITLKDLAPWPFAREVHLLKAPQPHGASWATSIQNGNVQTAASAEHEHRRFGVKVGRGCK